MSSYPPPPPSPTAEAVAALSTLTVRLLPPSAISSIEQIFLSNPRLSLERHLPLLGTIVVRHVALSLASQPPTASPTTLTTPPKPAHRTTSLPTTRLPPTPKSRNRLPRSRLSYRDIAYSAVRRNLLTTSLSPLPDSDPGPKSTISHAQTQTVHSVQRRLSLTVSRKLPTHTSPQPTTPVLRPVQPFARANASAAIPIRSSSKQPALQREAVMDHDNDKGRPSRLVQMRLLRANRKRMPLR